ncbi:SDR family oxidoreductase [Plantactinospora sp. B5E13]|uniref:SDR family oxidoreductase n=1 Tax=Plantactinospora sp. B5E13 TaxID=3153758 RepID=UPI00325F3527
MKIVVIGGSGLIGGKLVTTLRDRGHDVLPASPSTGVNTLTGEGLADALAGADVVVDVANSPSFEDAAVLDFFRTSGEHLLPAEAAAGVKHHVALSIVGVDRNPDSGYMRAKVAQEELIRNGSVPYTIVRATQFMEFIRAIAEGSADGDSIRLTSALMQPIAADDVVTAVADVALAAPVNGVVEIAGPEPLPLDDLGRRVLAANGDSRPVVTDPEARYFGSRLDDRSLVPDDGARLGTIHFADWLARAGAVK